MKDYCELELEEYKQLLQMASNLFKVYNGRVATASCPHVNVLEWRARSREFYLDWPNSYMDY